MRTRNRKRKSIFFKILIVIIFLLLLALSTVFLYKSFLSGKLPIKNPKENLDYAVYKKDDYVIFKDFLGDNKFKLYRQDPEDENRGSFGISGNNVLVKNGWIFYINQNSSDDNSLYKISIKGDGDTREKITSNVDKLADCADGYLLYYENYKSLYIYNIKENKSELLNDDIKDEVISYDNKIYYKDSKGNFYVKELGKESIKIANAIEEFDVFPDSDKAVYVTKDFDLFEYEYGKDPSFVMKQAFFFDLDSKENLDLDLYFFGKIENTGQGNQKFKNLYLKKFGEKPKLIADNLLEDGNISFFGDNLDKFVSAEMTNKESTLYKLVDFNIPNYLLKEKSDNEFFKDGFIYSDVIEKMAQNGEIKSKSSEYRYLKSIIDNPEKDKKFLYNCDIYYFDGDKKEKIGEDCTPTFPDYEPDLNFIFCESVKEIKNQKNILEFIKYDESSWYEFDIDAEKLGEYLAENCNFKFFHNGKIYDLEGVEKIFSDSIWSNIEKFYGSDDTFYFPSDSYSGNLYQIKIEDDKARIYVYAENLNKILNVDGEDIFYLVNDQNEEAFSEAYKLYHNKKLISNDLVMSAYNITNSGKDTYIFDKENTLYKVNGDEMTLIDENVESFYSVYTDESSDKDNTIVYYKADKNEDDYTFDLMRYENGESSIVDTGVGIYTYFYKTNYERESGL